MLASAIQVVGCPETIQDKQVVSPTPSAEWEVRIKSAKRPLLEVDVYSGPPEDIRILVGNTQKPGRAEWRFSKNEEVWVDCKYRHSAAVLRRKLQGVSQCALVRPKQPSSEPPTFMCTK
ncbi:STY0301 family protein [Lysobacter firmicutimachus]|uniref:STY0301 family protein n=1 Tax=Lysobacter firmicutimachus TaxID=1792846 RepID=UPI003CE5009D